MRRALVALGCCAFLACKDSAPSGGAGGEGFVDSALGITANGGGCQLPPAGVGPLGTLLLVNPEWAPVVEGPSPVSAPVLVHGTAFDAHVSQQDFPATHRSYDQNTGLLLDPADQGRIATGNETEATAAGEKLLELEWEVGSYPAWAWAGEGDRVIALGRWIFDCGHPDPSPYGTCETGGQRCSYAIDCGGAVCQGAGGTCRGSSDRCFADADCAAGVRCDGVEIHLRTELHPPQATAVVRQGRGGELGGSTVPVTRADVFVSGDGGGAGDLCVLTRRPTLDVTSAQCFPLSQPVALLPAGAPALATDFAFEVPLPAGGQGTPVWTVLPRDTPSVAGPPVPARLDVTPISTGTPRLSVVVRMAEPVGGSLPTGYAGTLLAGWSTPPTADLVRVRVTLEGIEVRDPTKPTTADPLLAPPPGWSVQASVNGEWQVLPGMDGIQAGSAGQVISQSVVWEQALPRSGVIRFFAAGSSANCVDTLMGRSLGDALVRFGGDLTRAATCLTGSAQDLGEIDVALPGPDFGSALPQGRQVLVSGLGAFAVRLRVERL